VINRYGGEGGEPGGYALDFRWWFPETVQLGGLECDRSEDVRGEVGGPGGVIGTEAGLGEHVD
jgi:hypothetical protein